MLSASRDVVFTFSNNVARKTGELPRSMAPSRSTIVAFATTRIEIFKVRTLPIAFVEAISRARKNAKAKGDPPFLYAGGTSARPQTACELPPASVRREGESR